MEEKTLQGKEETNDPVEYPFIKILRGATRGHFLSCLFPTEKGTSTYIPALPDVIAHLKLMRAFAVMKARVFETFGDKDELNEKNWQVFITNAVRRFIIFVSCLKHAVGPIEESDKDEEKRYLAGSLRDDLINDTLKKLLPPLDVLMVWHSFLLNPRAFYGHFMRNDFYKFANIPFPFYSVNLAIDNQTFEYNPIESLRKKYFLLLSPFVTGNTSCQEIDLERYDVSSFNMYDYKVDVVCPKCRETLVYDIPYTNDEKTGFADPNLVCEMTTKCACDFSSTITHDELRKRQLYSDSMNSALLPGVYRYFSSVLCHKIHHRRNCVLANEKILEIFNERVQPQFREHDLKTSISLATTLKASARPMLIIFRNYLNMNLIHLTISPPKGSTLKILEFSDDLVGMIARQERFVQRMNKLDWLHSPVVKETIDESKIRYKRFIDMTLLTRGSTLYVPTLDIDLIWHTHQLSPYYYFKYCHKSVMTTVIDHDDKVEQGKLDTSFENTCKAYRRQYNEVYSICYCWYCVTVRARSRSTASKLFKTEPKENARTYKSSPVLHDSRDLTHISSHNAIELPTKRAVKLRNKVQKKYSTKGTGKSGEVPWAAFSMGYYPWLYVVDPVAPVSLDHATLYSSGSGTCTIVNDTGYSDAAGGFGLSSGGLNSGVCTSGSCGGAGGGGGAGCGGGDGGGGSGGCGGCGGGG